MLEQFKLSPDERYEQKEAYEVYLPYVENGRRLTSKERLEKITLLDADKISSCLGIVCDYARNLNKPERAEFCEYMDDEFIYKSIFNSYDVANLLYLLAKNGCISSETILEFEYFKAFYDFCVSDFPQLFEEILAHISLDEICDVFDDVIDEERYIHEVSVRETLEKYVECYVCEEPMRSLCKKMLET